MSEKVEDATAAAVRRVISVPDFLINPRVALGRFFDTNYRTGKGVIAGVGYYVLGIFVFYAIGALRELDTSHLGPQAVGNVLLWVMYGLFLHLFVWAWGGRQGFFRTIDAYTYVIGLLQPVLAFVFFVLTFVYVLKYECRVQHIMGASGSIRYMTSIETFEGFSPTGANVLTLISGVLISFYMAPAFAIAHRMSLWRGIAASVSPALFFLLLYLFVGKWGKEIGLTLVDMLRKGCAP